MVVHKTFRLCSMFARTTTFRNRRGRFETLHVHKHGIEIIEVKVWPHTLACYRRESFKVTNILWQGDTNVQYTSKNTHLVVF